MVFFQQDSFSNKVGPFILILSFSSFPTRAGGRRGRAEQRWSKAHVTCLLLLARPRGDHRVKMFMLNSCTEDRGQEWVLLGGRQGVLLLDLHHQVAEAVHPKQLEEAGLYAEEGKLLLGHG